MAQAAKPLKSALLDEVANQEIVDALVRAITRDPDTLKPPELLKYFELIVKYQSESAGSTLTSLDSAQDLGQYTDAELCAMIATLDREIEELERQQRAENSGESAP